MTQSVFVYFNLHKKCFSIKALDGANKGKVIAHRNVVMLCSPTFKVSEAGRQRVLKEQRKNVHAGVAGLWCEEADTGYYVGMAQRHGDKVTYNPYKYSTFVTVADEQPVEDGLSIAVLSVDNSTKRSTIFVI